MGTLQSPVEEVAIAGGVAKAAADVAVLQVTRPSTQPNQQPALCIPAIEIDINFEHCNPTIPGHDKCAYRTYILQGK